MIGSQDNIMPSVGGHMPGIPGIDKGDGKDADVMGAMPASLSADIAGAPGADNAPKGVSAQNANGEDAPSKGVSAQNSSESNGAPVFNHYKDAIDWMKRRRAMIKLPTKAQLERERRRQHTNAIVSGLADGATAFANLFFTTKDAPNMYDPSQNLSDKMRERYDRIKAERDADEEKYLNYSMSIGKLEDEQEQKRYQRGRDALADRIRESQEERAQLKADRDTAMAELRLQLLQGKIDEQEAAAETKRIEKEYADRWWISKIKVNEAKANKDDRWQPKVSGGGSGRGSGGGPAYYGYEAQTGYVYPLDAKKKDSAFSEAGAKGLVLIDDYTQKHSENNVDYVDKTNYVVSNPIPKGKPVNKVSGGGKPAAQKKGTGVKWK